MGLAGLLCALLTVASLSLLLGDYTVHKHGYDQRDQAGQTRAGKRPKLSAPPTPLSVLVRGLEMYNGRALFITWSQPRRQPGAAVMDHGDPNPLFQIFQAPDLVHIVQYILSLLALLAAYDGICGERMRGTLALVFTGPLRRGVFIVGKALEVLLGQVAIFLPICVVVVGWLALMPGLGLAGGDWVRIGGEMVCSLLYMAIFVHMGSWASALFARPSSALSLPLALWLGWGIGWCNLSLSMGRWLVPYPTLAAFSTEVMRAQLAEMEEVAARLKAAHTRARHREVELGQMVARLSPLCPLTFMLTDLAGTGVAGEFHFRAGVERFKGYLVTYLHRQLAERSMWEQIEAESFPYFTNEPEVEKAEAEVLVFPLILLLYAIGFFLAAYLRFARAEF